MYCLNNTWRTQNIKPNKGPLHLTVMFDSLRIGKGGCENQTLGQTADQITFCPVKPKAKTACEGLGPIILINSQDLTASGVSAWVWIGIGAGVLIVAGVVFMIIKSKKEDGEEVTDRHTSEMVDQNNFQE